MKPYRNTARMAHVEHIFVGIPQGRALGKADTRMIRREHLLDQDSHGRDKHWKTTT